MLALARTREPAKPLHPVFSEPMEGADAVLHPSLLYHPYDCAVVVFSCRRLYDRSDRDADNPFLFKPPGWALDWPGFYLTWLFVVGVLYPVCRWRLVQSTAPPLVAELFVSRIILRRFLISCNLSRASTCVSRLISMSASNWRISSKVSLCASKMKAAVVAAIGS